MLKLSFFLINSISLIVQYATAGNQWLFTDSDLESYVNVQYICKLYTYTCVYQIN